ncbi:SpaA isopeptide-forming pilin-related protein [Anaerococcus sp. Marseille-Q5996]|uniref:SpaA isopeptide-forming pilin-related protein n=1 Tax=Anaerococcus sp. Marseille-Q5996 TaxID=2972769 RepID=UPI0021C86C5F|nr:SpaA isopeptide-forming pilin-related protein [Anaerococcus sp. Marseille-Q5996]
MKGKLQEFSVKLLASTLAVMMSIPANAFAMVGDNSNTYTENTSVMGIQAPEETKEDQVHTALLKSELSTDESDDYIIEKSASLSKTTGQIDYIIKIINKTPEKESSDKQTTTFAITQNTDLLDLKVEKVQALDANGNEEEINYTQGTPNAFNSTDNIRSTGITTNKPQNGVVYYLNAKLTDQALKDLEQKSPQLALDFTIASPDNKIYQDRYALEIEKANTTEITIDNEGNIANPEGRLVENQESLHLYKGEYKEEQKGIFQSTPAQIIWTDYINAKDNKEFTYDINLDQGQDTTESQVKIEYYEAQEKGYVLNESFTKTLAFANNLKLSIPEGYLAKVELNTRPKANTKEFAYNDIKIPNPTYTEEKNEAKEEQASDDADPLPNIFSKNDAEVNSSNDSITDQKDQNFSTNSKTDPAENLSATEEKNEAKEEQASDDADPLPNIFSKNYAEVNSSNDSITDQKDQNFSTNSKTDPVENLSAIALNKDAYFDKLKADDKLTANIEEATNEIEQILEAYNKEEINWDDFKQSVQNIKNDKEIDESQTKDILASLLIGLNEEKYKVANIDIDQAAGSDTEEKTEETADQGKTEEGKDLSDKTPYEQAAAKLAEEGVTIEDFQNYMYELERKYNLTDEDADRVYTENEEAIKKLISKAKEEKTTGDVFAVDNQSAFRKTYPYKTNYWTYQYYDQTKKTVNWDIRIETDQIKPSHLEFDNVGLSLYAPAAQGLTNFKVTVKDNLSDVSTNDNAKKVRERSDNGTTTFADSTLEQDGNLYKFNLNISKEKLPNDLIIHVEATPKDNHAKYQMYDLGLRLTPDKNYIQTVYEEFKNDWAKLVAAMPWIIPFKSGDGQVRKFEDGFNVVDTRLPADAMIAAYQDDKYKAKSYTDKSRSVFGEFAGTNTINWQISDTLRLQDDERFLNNPKNSLGNDIFDTAFNNNNNTGDNLSIEVLQPNKDGSFTPLQGGAITVSSAADFRQQLSSKLSVLVPGTVINYTFANTASKPTTDSTATIKFSNRFDDGVGYYGGEQTASLRKLTGKEQSSIVHVTQYNNDSTWMIIRESGEFALCINYGLQYPIIKLTGDNLKIHQKNIKDATIDDLNNYAGYRSSIDGNGLYKDRDKRNKARMYDDIKRALYLVENTDFQSEEEKYYVAQILMFRIIDIYSTPKMISNPDDAYNENTSLGKKVINGELPSESGLYTQIHYDSSANKFKPHKDKANEVFRKIPETKKESSNYYISSADVNEAVEINIYPTFEDGTGDKKKFQTVISYKAKNPLRINKVDSDNRPISGVSFNISGNGKNINYTSGQEPSKFYLPVGKYTVTETKTPQGYNTIDPFTIEVKEETNSVERAWDDLRRNESGSTTYYYPSNTAVISENNNYYVDQNGTRKSLVNIESKYINDFKEYQSSLKIINTKGRLEISKKLLVEDGIEYNLPGIKFKLTGKGSSYLRGKKEATTNKDGIAVFDNLPLNSQWTLEEVKTEGLSEVYTKWNVSVNSTGKVTITGDKDSRDPDNLFTIDPSDSSKITVRNEPDVKEPGNFKIKKIDSETKQPIKEVEFTLYGSDKKTQIGETTKTNENGEIYYSNLPNGIYYLKENIPQGYKAISEWTTIIVNNGQTSVVNVDITVGANGDMISLDPKYSLTIVNEIGNAIDTNITDGTINANNLNNGTYTIKDGDKEVLTIEVKNKKIVNLTDPNKPLNNSEDDNSTDDNPVKEPTEDPKPIETQYPKYIEVSNNENSVIVQFPDYTSKSVRVFQGKVDTSSWNTGTYTIENDGYGNRLVASVKDGQVVNLQKYRLQTPVPINGKTLYVKHDGYPSYMNFKEYSEVTNTNTGEITTYIMLKPDANNGGNGTDKNTIFNIYSSNSTIKKAELFRVGTGSTKSTVSNAMTNQNMRSYMNTTYVAKPGTQEYSQNHPISINGIQNNTVDLNTTSVRVNLPKERFANDWSFVLKITSDIDNKLEPAFFNYMWNSEASGEASITGDRDIPALQKYVKVSKLDNVIFANLLNTVKTSYNTLSELITPTVYAAEADVTKLEPSLVNDHNLDNTIEEKTVIEKINDGLGLIQDTPISNVLNLTFNVAEVLSPQSTSITKSFFNSVLNIEVEEGAALPSISDIKISNDKTEFTDINFDNVVEYEIENIPDKPGEGEIIVNKKDDSNNPLDGVEFTLYDFDWTKVASTSDRSNPQTTKDGGRVKWSNLPYGKYWLVETKSADGYIRNSEPRLVTISYEYNVPGPETEGKDVSNQLTLNRSSNPSPNISSSSGSESVVYPNNAEGLKVNLNYSVNSNSDIKPGDYFYLSISDNIDFDGVFNVDTVVKAGGHDIIGSQGTVAKASVVKTADGKKYLKYTFTNYVKERKLEDINMTLPLFINRIKVQNNGYQNMSIGIGSPTNRSQIFEDRIYVNYTDFYDKHPSARMVNSLPTKVDPATGYFRTIVYANQMKEYSWNKRITFSTNQNLTGLTYKVYVQNGDLPPSYGITTPGGLIKTYGTYTLDKGYQQTINLGPNNQYNSNTYYVVIEGYLDNKSFTEFKSRVIYESYIDNYYNSTNYYWDNEVKNYQPTYKSDGNLVYQMPVEVTVSNSKNEVEYTKIEALEGSVENNDTTSTSEVDSSVTKNKDNSITAINGAKFELRKLDETGKYKKVEGSGQESKDGGKLKWTKLAPGKYEVWETEAALGYETPKEAVAKFTVNKDGLVSKVERDENNEDNKVISQPYIGNKKIAKGKFKLLKVDSENNALEGVEFNLTGPNSYNKTLKSDGAGEIRFTDLEPGTYTLKETSTLSGYIKTNQEWTVTVSNGVTSIKPVNSESHTADSSLDDLNQLKSKGYLIIDENSNAEDPSVSTIKVLNRKATYPSTGGAGTFVGFALIGTAIMLAGIAYFAIFQNDKNRRRSDRYGR